MKLEIKEVEDSQFTVMQVDYPAYIQAKIYRTFHPMKDSFEYTCYFTTKVDPEDFSKVRIDLEISGDGFVELGLITEEQNKGFWAENVIKNDEKVYEKLAELAFEQYIEYLVDVQMLVRAANLNIKKNYDRDFFPIITEESIMAAHEKMGFEWQSESPRFEYAKDKDEA